MKSFFVLEAFGHRSLDSWVLHLWFIKCSNPLSNVFVRLCSRPYFDRFSMEHLTFSFWFNLIHLMSLQIWFRTISTRFFRPMELAFLWDKFVMLQVVLWGIWARRAAYMHEIYLLPWTGGLCIVAPQEVFRDLVKWINVFNVIWLLL